MALGTRKEMSTYPVPPIAGIVAVRIAGKVVHGERWVLC